MTVLQFNEFYVARHAVNEAVKQHAANNSHGPQFVPEAPMIVDADPQEYDRPHVNTGVDHVSTRQMCWSCVALFVVIVAVSFGPWWL